MNGCEYVSAFKIPEYPDLTVSEVATTEEASRFMNADLARMVISLYQDEQVHNLTDSCPPTVVTEASETLTELRETIQNARRMQQDEAKAMRKQGLAPAIRTETTNDTTHLLPDDKLSDLSETDKNNIQLSLAVYSWKVLNTVLGRIHKTTSRRNINDRRIAQEVKDTVMNERIVLGRVLQPFRGVIAIENDYDARGTLRLEDKVSTRVSVVRPHDRHTPTWLPAVNKWGDPLGRLCSAITEAEALLVLQEWIMARNLPYVPIIAPKEFEEGRLRRPSQGNLRADILLCCLAPRRNEIIPVQVKNYTHHHTQKIYTPNVVIVSPKDLGTEQAESRVVTNGSRQRLGTCLTMKYGSIMERYFAVHPLGKHKGHKPSKSEKSDYERALKPGFAHFDREVVERIVGYSSTTSASK